MKIKITLIAMLLFAGVVSTRAQGFQKRSPEERTQMLVNRLSDSLKLSDAQKTDVSAAYLDYFKGQDKLRESLQPGQRPEQADMDKLSDIRDAKLKIILKEEQYARLKSMEAAMRNRQKRS